MNRKLKALGLAFVAAFAMSAVVASGASAAETFHSDGHHTILDAESIGAAGQVFKTTVDTLKCTGVSVDGTTNETETHELTATATYSGCSAVGLKLTTRVTMTTCDYKFTSTLVEHTGQKHAEVHIECTNPEDEIDIEALFLGAYRQCVKVPPQTPTTPGVTYSNGGSGSTEDIVVKATVEGIKYTEVGICGSNTVHNDGTYEGEVTVKGTDTEGNHTAIWWA